MLRSDYQPPLSSLFSSYIVMLLSAYLASFRMGARMNDAIHIKVEVVELEVVGVLGGGVYRKGVALRI